MRKILALLALTAILAPAVALGQAHSINGKFFCNTATTSSHLIVAYRSTLGQWCPEATINEDGADVDFVIEGDTDTALFVTDAGNDRVGVSTASPSHTLHVAGDFVATSMIGADPPATCTAGQIYIDTDETDDTNCTTTADNSLCLCTAADTWTALENN